MYETLEPVTVVALFGGRPPVRPVKFRWAGRVVQIKEVTYHWIEPKGRKRLHHFSVTDGNNLYLLRFDPEALAWWVAGIETQ